MNIVFKIYSFFIKIWKLAIKHINSFISLLYSIVFKNISGNNMYLSAIVIFGKEISPWWIAGGVGTGLVVAGVIIYMRNHKDDDPNFKIPKIKNEPIIRKPVIEKKSGIDAPQDVLQAPDGNVKPIIKKPVIAEAETPIVPEVPIIKESTVPIIIDAPVKPIIIAEPEVPIIAPVAEPEVPITPIVPIIAPQEPVIAEVPIIKESVEDSFKALREAVTEPKKAPVIEKPIPVIENLEIAEYFIEKDNTVLVNTVIIKKSVDPEVLAEQLEYLKANKIVMEKVKFIEESNLTKTSKIIHHRDLKISEVNNAIDQIEVD